MRVGHCYLVHCGDWHTFVGRVKDQIGPLTYEFEQLSKVDISDAGDRWHELAAGDETLRRQATYWHFEGLSVLPLSIAAFAWVGELPQEYDRGEPNRRARR